MGILRGMDGHRIASIGTPPALVKLSALAEPLGLSTDAAESLLRDWAPPVEVIRVGVKGIRWVRRAEAERVVSHYLNPSKAQA